MSAYGKLKRVEHCDSTYFHPFLLPLNAVKVNR